MSKSPVPSPPSPTGKVSLLAARRLRDRPRAMAWAASSAVRLFLNAFGAIRTCICLVMKRRIYGNDPSDPVGLSQHEQADHPQQDEAVFDREAEKFGFAAYEAARAGSNSNRLRRDHFADHASADIGGDGH